ncbi:MAG: hypothetical protein RJA55_2324 [Acidobacteriota bacterium]
MSDDATPAKVRLTDGLGPLVDSEEDPARLWAEIHTLRAAVAGPKGYASWQEAATSERMRRVRKEQQIETLLRGITDARCLMDPIWRERMGAESVLECVKRGLRCIDSAVTDCQFTGPNVLVTGARAAGDEA